MKEKNKNKNESEFMALVSKIKDKGLLIWSRLSLYGKIVTVASIVILFFMLVAILFGKTIASFISVLMHQGIIKIQQEERWVKNLVLVCAILLMVVNVKCFSWEKTSEDTRQITYEIKHKFPQIDESGDEETDTTVLVKDTEEEEREQNEEVSIAEETEQNESNVYIATAISDSIIKVEHWDKNLSSSKKVKYDSDVGVYKINDSSSGFEWVDREHMAFRLTIDDKSGWFKKEKSVIFTVNTDDADENKGSNCDKRISKYAYENDDWHSYRAIFLTDKLIKIEAWCRTSSHDKLLYGYDVGLIDLESEDTDFAWTDDEHTSFTITTKDKKNKSNWKKEKNGFVCCGRRSL